MGYSEYIIKRLVYSFIVLFIVVTLNFIIFMIMPGDPVKIMIGRLSEPSSIALLRERFGLDKPLWEQYILYIRNMFTLNFGFSFITYRPVSEEIIARLPNTIVLLGTSTIIAALIGIILGVYAAVKRGKSIDVFVIGVGLFVYGLPVFWIGMLLLFFLGFRLGLFPLYGSTSRPPPTDPVLYVADFMWHLALPLTTLVFILFGGWALFTRNTILDILTEDYVITARAKGLKESHVLFRHVLRNALLPITTRMGLSLASIVSGATLTETIFSWYGIGRYIYDAAINQNYPALQGTFFMIAVVTIAANFIVDLLYGVLDPRVRVGE